MAADVTVTAMKSFEYRGQRRRRGERVPMAPIDATIHARRGDVTLVRNAVVRSDPEPAPEPTPAPTRRRYRRRDMVAESSPRD